MWENHILNLYFKNRSHELDQIFCFEVQFCQNLFLFEIKQNIKLLAFPKVPNSNSNCSFKEIKLNYFSVISRLVDIKFETGPKWFTPPLKFRTVKS